MEKLVFGSIGIVVCHGLLEIKEGEETESKETYFGLIV